MKQCVFYTERGRTRDRLEVTGKTEVDMLSLPNKFREMMCSRL